MTVSAAMRGFKKTAIVWKLNGRQLGEEGSIDTPTLQMQTLTGVVTEPKTKNVILEQSSTAGVDELNVYFKGRPVFISTGRSIEREDILNFLNADFTVREARFRPEGNFTKCVVKQITRRDLEA